MKTAAICFLSFISYLFVFYVSLIRCSFAQPNSSPRSGTHAATSSYLSQPPTPSSSSLTSSSSSSLPSLASSYSQVEFPCTSAEKWTYSAAISDELKSFNQPFQDKGKGFEILSQLILSKKSRSNEIHAIKSYIHGKVLYNMGLKLTAARFFGGLIETPPSAETDSIRLAAAACLNQVWHIYPGLIFHKRGSETERLSIEENFKNLDLHQLSIDQKASLVEVLAREWRSQIMAEHKNKSSVMPSPLIAQSFEYRKFLWGLESAIHGKSEDAIQAYESLIQNDRWPGFLADKKNPIYLALASAYFEAQNYVKSAQYFSQIKKDAFHYPHALIGLAWIASLKNRYKDVQGWLRPFFTGNLKDYFAPQSYTVLAISLFETCHFEDTINVLHQMDQIYGPSKRWLSHWHAEAKKKGVQQTRLFTQLSSSSTSSSTSPSLPSSSSSKDSSGHSSDSGIQIPERIRLAWISSPLIIDLKEILELMSRERIEIQKLNSELSHQHSSLSSRPQEPLFAEEDTAYSKSNLRSILALSDKNIVKNQGLVIEILNNLIASLNFHMIQELNDAKSTRDYLEVDTFEAMGDRTLHRDLNLDFPPDEKNQTLAFSQLSLESVCTKK